MPIIRLQRSGRTAALGTKVQRRRILPRSLHLPVAVVDGSLTQNLNKTGVRLWTEPSLDEHGEVGRGDTLDAVAHRADGEARSDERCGTAVAVSPTRVCAGR